tara:strand:- start:1525 stop:1737 length:213 start_codon:yes stop_codon:yes gene_type:complete
MTEESILDTWAIFTEYIDKKHLSVVAERYIDLLADYDIDINVIKNLIGNYEELDTAIDYYLDSEITDDDY